MAVNSVFAMTEAGQTALTIHPHILDGEHPSASQGMIFLAAIHHQLGNHEHLLKMVEDILVDKGLTPLG